MTGAKDPTNWWPNVLFDTRGRRSPRRQSQPPASDALTIGGAMHYVRLDASPTLAKCFKATAPLNSAGRVNARTDNGGFTGLLLGPAEQPRPRSSKETGEYGWE